MKKQKLYSLFFFSLFLITAYSQAPKPEQQKILGTLTDYFKLDRENIHLHLNKTTYLTNESIWFKGYVIEKKDRLPFAGTSNVYVSLFDATGNKLLSNLIFADNSLFEGDIQLNKTFKSGKYYLQVFTNYMNNFEEDESSVYQINIINILDGGYTDDSQIDYTNIDVAFFPESGVFLEGTSNTVAIRITDCRDNGIVVKGGDIVDSKGNVVTNFTTNQLGYGKFDILSTANDAYKAVFYVNENRLERQLPAPVMEGIAFSANNYTFPDKAIIKVKTNPRSIKDKADEPFTLVIQQNDRVSFVDFSFKDKTEQTISVPNVNFSEGLNAIHLIDKNQRELAERVVFVPAAATSKITEVKLAYTKSDSLVISGSSQFPLASLSISVLPLDAEIPKKDIRGTMQFDAYLNTPTANSAYFLNNFSRSKHYELDTYLMTKKSKYRWEKMMAVKPVEKYEFDNGLTIKGSVNNAVGNHGNYRLNMLSQKWSLNEFTALDEKNEFVFKNIFVIDSAVVYFSLINKKNKVANLSLYSQTLNNNRQFMKPLAINTKVCPVKAPIIQNNDAFPKIENAIQLDSISIKSQKERVKLVNNRSHGNGFSKGIKIDQTEAGSRDIADFLMEHGYNVSRSYGDVTIRNTHFRSTINGSGNPAIFIDDVQLDDFSLLTTYRLKDVDEIYLNKRGAGEGMNAAYGSIRIYMRTDYGAKKQAPQPKLLIKNGFQPYDEFINPKFENVTDKGFLKYGTINWMPQVNTDKEGNFQFSIPNMNQNTVKIIIEGITTDGQLISETHTLSL